MPTFDYRADDAQGRPCKGRLEADSPRHARQLLRERGLWPRDVSEIRVDCGHQDLVWHWPFECRRSGVADTATVYLGPGRSAAGGSPRCGGQAECQTSGGRPVVGRPEPSDGGPCAGHGLGPVPQGLPRTVPRYRRRGGALRSSGPCAGATGGLYPGASGLAAKDPDGLGVPGDSDAGQRGDRRFSARLRGAGRGEDFCRQRSGTAVADPSADQCQRGAAQPWPDVARRDRDGGGCLALEPASADLAAALASPDAEPAGDRRSAAGDGGRAIRQHPGHPRQKCGAAGRRPGNRRRRHRQPDHPRTHGRRGPLGPRRREL